MSSLSVWLVGVARMEPEHAGVQGMPGDPPGPLQYTRGPLPASGSVDRAGWLSGISTCPHFADTL